MQTLWKVAAGLTTIDQEKGIFTIDRIRTKSILLGLLIALSRAAVQLFGGPPVDPSTLKPAPKNR